MTQVIAINKDLKRVRLDKALSILLENVSRSKIQEYLEKGLILVNSKIEKPSYKLRVEDEITIMDFPNETIKVEAEDIPQAFEEDEYEAIVLVPAEEYLFDYCSKFGFETKFNKKVVHYTRSELAALATEPDLSEAFKLNVFETRQTSFGFKDFFNWGEAALKYAMMEHTYCSGSIAFTSDGYAMYNMGKDTVYVKEMCTLSDPSELFKMLLLEDGAEKFTFNLPSFSSICKEDETVENVGMSVPTSEEGKKAQEVLNNAWIGLTLG